MNEDDIKTCDALWRQALDIDAARWCVGMAAFGAGQHWRAIVDEESGDCGWYDVTSASERTPAWDTADAVELDGMTPVWSDPATLGCLRDLMREACSDSKANCVWSWPEGPWFVDAVAANKAEGATEAEALLRAILAAGGGG